jgi:hypothetical protein
MAKSNATASRKPTVAIPEISDPSTWPLIWRVVAPCCGSHDHDMVFIETKDEQNARAHLRSLRRTGYPVRLERTSCGPLPRGADERLLELRQASPQNPGTSMRQVLGAWSDRSHRAEGARS